MADNPDDLVGIVRVEQFVSHSYRNPVDLLEYRGLNPKARKLFGMKKRETDLSSLVPAHFIPAYTPILMPTPKTMYERGNEQLNLENPEHRKVWDEEMKLNQELYTVIHTPGCPLDKAMDNRNTDLPWKLYERNTDFIDEAIQKRNFGEPLYDKACEIFSAVCDLNKATGEYNALIKKELENDKRFVLSPTGGGIVVTMPLITQFMRVYKNNETYFVSMLKKEKVQFGKV